ncbi:hypothetical protein DFR70_1011054 [Nocardia tenerifensis]|uniref:Uncharacterized protein n=1 Tax=Nocardia tenerifensis TaxID=228006 RepID=A0A318KPP3_9NOCA|nr:hypothetical protein [Nocardia tenerifensis]PXX71620.1 hypothetical protein DFR70_1011054 [Nocardia tenerifensis]
MTAFDDLVAEVPAERFGHREHVHVTWLALRRFGIHQTIALVDDGLRSTARYAGVPQKYNSTVSRAWVHLVAHHLRHTPADDFADFIDRNPELLDKRLLIRFYQPSTLASTAARTGWVAPDRAPFPTHLTRAGRPPEAETNR